jgi:hypothetical protein
VVEKASVLPSNPLLISLLKKADKSEVQEEEVVNTIMQKLE